MTQTTFLLSFFSSLLVFGRISYSRVLITHASSDDIYRLQDNWVLDTEGIWNDHGGYWIDAYEYYNCYAYVISDIVGDDNLGFFYPGCFSDYRDDSICSNSRLAAEMTRRDLVTFGLYAEVYDYCPEIEGWQTLICVRTGSNDYHFMRYEEDGYWHHKPAHSAPLCYKYAPEDRDWTIEVSSTGIENTNGYVYDGDVFYIVFGHEPSYTESVTYISTADCIRLNTLYFTDSQEVGFLGTDLGIVGFYYSLEYFTECQIDYSSLPYHDIIAVELIINANCDSECYLFDSTEQYVDTIRSENGIFTINLSTIIENENDIFYLLPVDENHDIIHFDYSNTVIRLTELIMENTNV